MTRSTPIASEVDALIEAEVKRRLAIQREGSARGGRNRWANVSAEDRAAHGRRMRASRKDRQEASGMEDLWKFLAPDGPIAKIIQDGRAELAIMRKGLRTRRLV